jgi:beta-lactamase superfamily II metal-dependent hydrolase
VRQRAELEVARGRKNDRRTTHGKTAVEGDAAHEQVAEQMQEASLPPHETASVAMTGDLEVEVLPASEGESLLLSYRDQNGTHHILIDCGPASTGTSLKDRLTALPTEGFLDLLVLTNIDQGRIGGAMSVLQDRQVTYGDIWFNGWQQTREYL